MREVYEQLPPVPGAFHRFGAGSWLVPPCEVIGAPAIAIGENVVLLEFSSLRVLGDVTAGPKLVLGDRVRLTRFVTIVCEVSVDIGDDVASSDGVAVIDTWRDLPGGLGIGDERLAWPPAPVRIDNGAYLGYGSTILPGVHVGEGAFVGEGAVVVEDVPAHTLVYGNPARVIRRYDPVAGAWEGPRWP
jgi:acetyltransferase-like isoleucine patch superfamily enzyme